MTRRVGPKGQVVLPKAMRDALGIKPGDEVDFEFDGVGVRVIAAGPPPDWRRFRGSTAGHDLLADLAAEREQERQRDERREHERSSDQRAKKRSS